METLGKPAAGARLRPRTRRRGSLHDDGSAPGHRPQRTGLRSEARGRGRGIATASCRGLQRPVFPARICSHAKSRPCPVDPPGLASRRVKGPAARSANQLLGRAGKPFWQEEYFDRLVRTEKEFSQIRRYIEWNPVTAALAAVPEEFPWSSACAGLKPRAC
jgi:hypothetical protein